MTAPTSFRIDYQRHGSLLRAHVTGVNGTLETTLAYWMSLAEEVRRDRPRNLLVVDDMEGDPPPPEQLAEFVQAMVGMGFEGVRVAYVEAHAQQIPEVEVGEILAREQGFDARVFGNETDASLWLRHGLS
jgi:ketopantoate hydroxymethyltransferase